MNAELIHTRFGNVLVAELEDGTIKSCSTESAANDLAWVIENGNLPETFDSTGLEIVLEYLKSLAEQDKADSHE